jgi:hypothetical protein
MRPRYEIFRFMSVATIFSMLLAACNLPARAAIPGTPTDGPQPLPLLPTGTAFPPTETASPFPSELPTQTATATSTGIPFDYDHNFYTYGGYEGPGYALPVEAGLPNALNLFALAFRGRDQGAFDATQAMANDSAGFAKDPIHTEAAASEKLVSPIKQACSTDQLNQTADFFTAIAGGVNPTIPNAVDIGVTTFGGNETFPLVDDGSYDPTAFNKAINQPQQKGKVLNVTVVRDQGTGNEGFLTFPAEADEETSADNHEIDMDTILLKISCSGGATFNYAANPFMRVGDPASNAGQNGNNSHGEGDDGTTNGPTPEGPGPTPEGPGPTPENPGPTPEGPGPTPQSSILLQPITV